MIVTVNILVAVAAIVLGYLFGAIPTGVVIGKVFFGKDPRDFYSHNSGGTNTGRVLGKKIGILVIFLDMLKTCIPIYVVWAVVTFAQPIAQYMVWENGYFAAPLWYWLSGLFAALGHCWPIYIHFKGGKAVACLMGYNAFTSWIEFVGAGFSYLICLKITKYVSLTSMISSCIATAITWTLAIIQVTVPTNLQWMMWTMSSPYALQFCFECAAINTVLTVIVIIRHKENIKRLIAGTELKTTDKLAEK